MYSRQKRKNSSDNIFIHFSLKLLSLSNIYVFTFEHLIRVEACFFRYLSDIFIDKITYFLCLFSYNNGKILADFLKLRLNYEILGIYFISKRAKTGNLRNFISSSKKMKFCQEMEVIRTTKYFNAVECFFYIIFFALQGAYL